MWTEFIEYLKTGAPVIRKHTVPVPKYEVGDVVFYKEDKNAKEQSGVVDGYRIDVFRLWDDRRNKWDLDCTIFYCLEGGDEIHEEGIVWGETPDLDEDPSTIDPELDRGSGG